MIWLIFLSFFVSISSSVSWSVFYCCSRILWNGRFIVKLIWVRAPRVQEIQDYSTSICLTLSGFPVWLRHRQEVERKWAWVRKRIKWGKQRERTCSPCNKFDPPGSENSLLWERHEFIPEGSAPMTKHFPVNIPSWYHALGTKLNGNVRWTQTTFKSQHHKCPKMLKGSEKADDSRGKKMNRVVPQPIQPISHGQGLSIQARKAEWIAVIRNIPKSSRTVLGLTASEMPIARNVSCTESLKSQLSST